MLDILFWLFVFLVASTYLFYPLVLWLLTVGKTTPLYAVPETWPSVSLIITAYNEAAVIKEKIENSLQLDYPQDKLEIIVISDCSDDGTDEIIQDYITHGVRFFRQPERSGKTLAQNAATAQATGEILVFSDANSMYITDAISTLVQPFADTSIGCICGELHYANPDQGGAGKGEGFYWRYEQFLKRRESLRRSLVGANGSIYALRRSLFEPLAADIISDFIMPIRVYCKGHAVIYVPEALATEHSAGSYNDEFRRRTRIIARSLNGLRQQLSALNPFIHGLFAFQLFSHKVLRWLVPFFMFGAFITNSFLLIHPLYLLIFILQSIFYLLAALGNLFPRALGRFGLFYVPAYFCAINFGALLGWWRFMRGSRFAVWQPVERN